MIVTQKRFKYQPLLRFWWTIFLTMFQVIFKPFLPVLQKVKRFMQVFLPSFPFRVVVELKL
jgi:hypothetical protein